MKDRVLVKTVNKEYEAEIVKGFLEANGIKAFILVHDESYTSPYPFSYVTGIKIYVNAENGETASKLLKKIK